MRNDARPAFSRKDWEVVKRAEGDAHDKGCKCDSCCFINLGNKIAIVGITVAGGIFAAVIWWKP